MKKTILAVVLTMVIMSVFGGFVINKINKQHEAEMDKLETRYEDKIYKKDRKIKNFEKQVDEYNEQIYNIVEGKNYKVTINRNGTYVTYRKENTTDKFGKLFGIKNTTKQEIKFNE